MKTDPTADPSLVEWHPLLSVIIPTLDEESTISALLQDLARLTVPYEVIVVDGGSADQTRPLAGRAGARVFRTPAGRGGQLRHGADRARAPLLFFVHADVRLDEDIVRLLDRSASAPPARAVAFRLRIDARGWAYRLIEWGANLRSRAFGLPYGDQGLLVRRDAYDGAGGFPVIPLMEDVALVRALRASVGVSVAKAALRVSSRRWSNDGPLRRMVSNWVLVVRYLTGTPPERLAARYPAKDGSRG